MGRMDNVTSEWKQKKFYFAHLHEHVKVDLLIANNT